MRKYTKCIFRLFRKVYTIPVDHPESDVADDFYDYIDGLHGNFPPISCELLLETSDRTEIEQKLDKLGEDMKRLYLDRRKMPETVQITQYDLRAQFDDEAKDSSLDDRLTPITILNEPDDPLPCITNFTEDI